MQKWKKISYKGQQKTLTKELNLSGNSYGKPQNMEGFRIISSILLAFLIDNYSNEKIFNKMIEWESDTIIFSNLIGKLLIVCFYITFLEGVILNYAFLLPK